MMCYNKEIIMDKFEAALRILYLLSSIDGEVNGAEVKIIMAYLKENQAEINFDHRSVIQNLLFMGKEKAKIEIGISAMYYKESSIQEERINLLDFAANLVAADGKFDLEEIRLFIILGEKWDIDIDKFMKNR
jgi:tellurite resistance protein